MSKRKVASRSGPESLSWRQFDWNKVAIDCEQEQEGHLIVGRRIGPRRRQHSCPLNPHVFSAQDCICLSSVLEMGKKLQRP